MKRFRLKFKHIYTTVLSDGTKVFHFLKEDGSITLRTEIPKENVKDFMRSEISAMRGENPRLAAEMCALFMGKGS